MAPLRGAVAARAAADRLVAKLVARIGALEAELARLRAPCAGASPEVCPVVAAGIEADRRWQIAKPAVVNQLLRRPVPGRQRRRRNVALHAAECPPATASETAFGRAQRAERLGRARTLLPVELLRAAPPPAPAGTPPADAAECFLGELWDVTVLEEHVLRAQLPYQPATIPAKTASLGYQDQMSNACLLDGRCLGYSIPVVATG